MSEFVFVNHISVGSTTLGPLKSVIKKIKVTGSDQ